MDFGDRVMLDMILKAVAVNWNQDHLPYGDAISTLQEKLRHLIAESRSTWAVYKGLQLYRLDGTYYLYRPGGRLSMLRDAG